MKVLGGRGGREPVPNTALSSLESFYLKMGSYVTPFFFAVPLFVEGNAIS